MNISVGDHFGCRTVIYIGIRRNFVLCQCQCLHISEAKSSHLKRGIATACLNCRKSARLTHGHKRQKKQSLTYMSYASMLQRCHNPNLKCWKRYGGRGIQVCERWRTSFQNFLDDMGERPSRAYQIERKNNDGPYASDNCIWTTAKEQQRNKSTTWWITYQDVTQCLASWAEQLGKPYSVLQLRLNRGWTIERAFETPLRSWPTSWKNR